MIHMTAGMQPYNSGYFNKMDVCCTAAVVFYSNHLLMFVGRQQGCSYTYFNKGFQSQPTTHSTQKQENILIKKLAIGNS